MGAPHSASVVQTSFWRFLRQLSVSTSQTLPPPHFELWHQVGSSPGPSQVHSTQAWAWQILPLEVAWSGQQSASASQPSRQLSLTHRAPFSAANFPAYPVDPLISYSHGAFCLHCPPSPTAVA